MRPDLALEKAVLDALNCGYRMIDTAQAYMNERAVGRGMKKSGVPREEIFLSTKIWASQYLTEGTVEKSLELPGISEKQIGNLCRSSMVCAIRQHNEQIICFKRSPADKLLYHTRHFCTPVYIPELIRRITAVYPTAPVSAEVNGVPQLLEGIKNGTYHAILLPFCPEDDALSCRKWGKNIYPSSFRNATVSPAENL